MRLSFRFVELTFSRCYAQRKSSREIYFCIRGSFAINNLQKTSVLHRFLYISRSFLSLSVIFWKCSLLCTTIFAKFSTFWCRVVKVSKNETTSVFSSKSQFFFRPNILHQNVLLCIAYDFVLLLKVLKNKIATTGSCDYIKKNYDNGKKDHFLTERHCRIVAKVVANAQLCKWWHEPATLKASQWLETRDFASQELARRERMLVAERGC